MRPVSMGAQVKYFACCALLAALTIAPRVASQEPLETPQQTNERIHELSSLAQNGPHDYIIGAGDLVAVEVFEVPELTRDIRVSQAGTIALPLLPVRLHVAGLTEMQLEQKIAEVLEANGLVSRPQVTVTVKEKKSKPITVIGAVGHPMVYQADRQVTLLEVLSEAGGIANDAGSTVIVRRATPAAHGDSGPPAVSSPAGAAATPSSSSPASADPAPADPGAGKAATGAALLQDPPATQEAKTPPTDPPKAATPGSEPPDLSGVPVTLTISLTDLLDSGDPKYNIPIEGGDVIMVPRAGIIYVMGAVDRPGGFVLSNDRNQMSTLKILSLAGGLQRTARSSQAVILRRDSSGQQRQVNVDLQKIMERKIEDVALYPSDILYVPVNTGKRAVLHAAEIALAVTTAVVIFRLSK